MTSVLANLRDLLAYAATKPGHDRRDREAASALAAPLDSLGLPPELEVRWLGVAGFALTCEGTTIAIDPYVTRLPLDAFLRRRVVGPDHAAIAALVPRCDAILLGHTHFDHALDAPAIAQRDGATVYGGASARRLMALHGLADAAVEVQAKVPFEVGPFRITFVPSAHSRLVLGRHVPSGGEITCEHVDALVPQAYCCGQVWDIQVEVAGATLYHQGSADLIDDEVPRQEVDAFLCGIAGRQVTDRYLPRILGRLSPRVVVASHHDDFFRPAGSGRFAFGVDLARFPDEVAAVSSDLRVVVAG